MYDVKVYSLKAEGSRQITDHFRVYEFACSDGSDVVFVSQALADILENIRVHFGKPVHINSGYRTVSYNKTVSGSSSTSQHCNGLAADIRVEGVSPDRVADYAEQLLGDHGGIAVTRPLPMWTSGPTRAAGKADLQSCCKFCN